MALAHIFAALRKFFRDGTDMIEETRHLRRSLNPRGGSFDE